MILEQIYLGCLSQASYLIGDENSGEAAIVDPRRDIDEYLQRAEALGLAIRHVLLTHFHADFVSGHVELRERVGAKIYLGAGAEADYPFVPLADGDTIEMGAVRIQALSTPGHTPESTSYVVYDLAADREKPHAVLTGDTLFIGDVGRPDLLASLGVTAKTLAGMMYESLHEKLLALPDETLVYPGHGAGSACGKNLSTDTVSTIGQQRRFNCALQAKDKDEFVAMLTADQPPAPAYFGHDADLNRRERQTLSAAMAKARKAWTFDKMRELQEQGAQVLDVRSEDDYAKGHLRGCTNIGLGGKFASWCGTILDKDRPIVLIATPGTEDEAIMRLGRIGFDNVAGYLEGGIAAVPADQMAQVGRLRVKGFDAALTAEPKPFLLDVRVQGEVEQGALEGHVHIPLHELPSRLGEVPQDRDVLTYCGTGYRSSIAMSLLEAHGHTRLTDLIGGWAARVDPHVGT
ncbi:MAG: MBL fold metallo-hydrolase [Planctomycetota bacterium]|jgi:glyoxylase-like metal-dependent hydrolase (beta-lactamase superfamily II)/rhodanese-related sulfurtransferase